MIRINLLGSNIEKDPRLLNFAISWVVALCLFILACIGWWLYLLNDVKHLGEEYILLTAELAMLETKTKKNNDINEIKKDLNEKLYVITVLKKNKLGPVKLLDTLNLSLPKKVWLERIEEANQKILITGKSLDDKNLSLFMKALQQSDYFKNVDLSFSKQFFMEDVKIKDFEIKADISYASDNKASDNEASDNPFK